MDRNGTEDIIRKLAELELDQEKELLQLLQKQRKARRNLLKSVTAPTQKTQVTKTSKPVLSFNKIALKRGDQVKVRTTTSIGTKGDIATVLFVSPPRVDIYVHRLNDTSWRMPHNLEH